MNESLHRSVRRVVWMLAMACAALCVAASDEDAKSKAAEYQKKFNAPVFEVQCGDVRIGISESKMWTITGIYYKDSLVGVLESAYGTIFHIPGIGGSGQIGSAHIDVEREDIKKLEFELNGAILPDTPKSDLRGESFRMLKVSRIRDVTQEYTVAISENRLEETIRITAQKAMKFDSVNMFAHPWVPTVDRFLAVMEDGKEKDGELGDTEKDKHLFHIRGEVKWVAIFDSNSGKGAVSWIDQKPAIGGVPFWLWNEPGIYRKAYVPAFTKQTMPEGFDGTYRMITEFFEATPADWRDEARSIGAGSSIKD